jgi:hypothetical protein
VSAILLATGFVALGVGSWRSWMTAREALGPLIHEGDATRSAIEASRPIHARVRVRLFARRVTAAVGWLLVAMYGLYLVSAGSVAW